MNQLEHEPSPEVCNICGQSMAHVSSAQILGKYSIQYFSCSDCGFLRTEKPYWLTEAYSQAIAAADTGIVQRNLAITRQLTCLLPNLFGSLGMFLDVAGGTGLLTRLMRDNGFDFYWEDRYCQNILAAGFESSEGAADYQAVTAFEAIEHMEQPYEFIKSCLARSTTRTFIFSTELFEPPLPDRNWWYFAHATGQHISFFSMPTLQRVAQQLQLNFVSYRGLHMFTSLPLSQQSFCKFLEQEDHGLYESIRNQRVSLTQSDHQAMTRRALGLTPWSIQEAVTSTNPLEKSHDRKPAFSNLNWLDRAIRKLKRQPKRNS
jgi:hypothetical protein